MASNPKDKQKLFYTKLIPYSQRQSFNRKNIPTSKVSVGLVSLLLKGILTHVRKYYSIHYKLVPYIRIKSHLEYVTVLREICSKK
jgi:hypothetical protein